MTQLKNLKLPINEISRLQTYVLSLRNKAEEIDTPLFDLAKEIVYGETNGSN